MDVFMCRLVFCCVCCGRFGSDRGGRDRLSSWRGVSFFWGMDPAYATEVGSFYSFVFFSVELIVVPGLEPVRIVLNNGQEVAVKVVAQRSWQPPGPPALPSGVSLCGAASVGARAGGAAAPVVPVQRTARPVEPEQRITRLRLPVKRGRGSEAAASSDGGHDVEARRPRDCVFYQLPRCLLRGVEGLGESDMGTVGERAGALDCAVEVGLSGVDESEIFTAGLSGSVVCVTESSGSVDGAMSSPMYIAVADSGCVRKCDGLLELGKGAPMYLNLRASDGAERMCVECCGELEGLS